MKKPETDGGLSPRSSAGRQAQPGMTKAAQREATVARLIAVARDRFAQHGYAAAATEELVQAAGVTRGALYHHFESKEGLFRAVLAQVHAEVGQRVGAAAEAETDDWNALLAGCRAFLAAANDPAIQRIMLIDGPAVLGWSEWRAMDAEHSLRLLRDHLALLSLQGVLRTGRIDGLAHLLSGAMNELALWVAQRGGDASALDEASAVLEETLEGLRT